MGSYRGSAALVLEDGREIAVEVEASSWVSGSTLVDWEGVAVAVDPATGSPWEVLEQGGARLRLPNGRDGGVVPRRFDAATESLEFGGCGEPPF